MQPKCSVYVAVSVDGFIARADGDVGWLERPEYSAVSIKGLRYETFMATVDALVMGRHTFAKALTFAAWPYERTPVVVLSNQPLEIPTHISGTVWHDAGEPLEIVERLASSGKQHLYIDGGVTIQRFLAAQLINEITITRMPILLGAGIPLFGGHIPEQDLQLIDVAVSENGVVQERFQVKHQG